MLFLIKSLCECTYYLWFQLNEQHDLLAYVCAQKLLVTIYWVKNRIRIEKNRNVNDINFKDNLAS